MRILEISIPLLLTYYHNIGRTPANRCYSSKFEDYGSPCSEEFRDDEFVENIKKGNETDSKTIDENSVYSRSGIPPWEYIQRVRHKGLPP